MVLIGAQYALAHAAVPAAALHPVNGLLILLTSFFMPGGVDRHGRQGKGELRVEFSRGEFLRLGLVAGVALALPFGAFACSGQGSTGTMLPSKAKLPAPFQVPLPIPPVLARRADADADRYEIVQRAATAEILPGLEDRSGATRAPSPGRPSSPAAAGDRRRHRNELPYRPSSHLHGGRTPPEHDGYPTDLILPARSTARPCTAGTRTIRTR